MTTFKFDHEKPMHIDYHFNVPPGNSVHVVVSDHSKGQSGSQFYVAIEDYEDNGVWRHRKGTTHSCRSLAKAFETAEDMWLREQATSGGTSRFKGTPTYRAKDVEDNERDAQELLARRREQGSPEFIIGSDI